MPTAYASRLAAVANDQFDRFRIFHETDLTLRNQIERYWVEIGLKFPGVGTAWSAVFISWCVQKAGSSAAEFKFSSRHSVFVKKAISQANNPAALFIGRRLTEYSPQIGDIIQNNRDGNSFDFDFAASNGDYKSHSAIVVETGVDGQGKYLLTIGGNENDTVGRRIVRLQANGRVKQPMPDHFICIIANLK